MANRERTYYFEFCEPGNQFSPGVYTDVDNRMHYRMFDRATRVWRQGCHGGVKIVREDWCLDKKYGQKYVTKDEEAMKHFMWVKLQAQPYNKGA